jgi:hypothetical protein
MMKHILKPVSAKTISTNALPKLPDFSAMAKDCLPVVFSAGAPLTISGLGQTKYWY